MTIITKENIFLNKHRFLHIDTFLQLQKTATVEGYVVNLRVCVRIDTMML